MSANIRIVPLGGLGEVGKNMMSVEYGRNVLIVDAGGKQTAQPEGIALLIGERSSLVPDRIVQQLHAAVQGLNCDGILV